ncbi:MAG: PAS domain S-box protein [Prolixibacteraceae bacterium]|nr:PAS domain S-box protein [Prolixibacteraceae bacterium]
MGKQDISREGFLKDIKELKLEISSLKQLLQKQVEESKEIEQALRLSEERYRLLSELSPEMIYLIDKNGYILYVNSAAAATLKSSATEVMGKHLTDVFSNENARSHLAAIKKVIASGQKIQNEILEKFPIGEIWIEASLSPLFNDKNEITAVLGITNDITSRKSAEEAIQESYRYSRNLIEASLDPLVTIDKFGKITDVNHATETVTGVTREILVGSDFSDYFTDSDKARVGYNEVFNKGFVKDYPLSIRHINGQITDVLYNASLYQNKDGSTAGVFAAARDITTRKAIEEKLRKLSQAVEQSPVSIVITDTNGSIEYVNPKFTEITGYSFEESIGQNPKILKSETKKSEDYAELWQTILSGKIWSGEFYNKKKNGDYYWENATISPILNEQNEISHFLAIKEDITQRKLVEQELLKAKEMAEESDQLKSAFLANMSHEIRTPMNGILGFAELLKEPNLSGEEQQEYIKIIEKSGIRMLNIINDIIDISKIESGQMKLHMNESNINSQVDYIYTFFKPEVEKKGMKLIMKNSLPDEEVILKTDREKLFAILTNLVKNAIKYSESGNIEFGYEKKGKYLEFYVKDSGIGIKKERQTAIFERFVQVDISDIKARQGAGLGLTITKSYVEMLGGKIWVESEIGVGSTFYFTIPFEKAEDRSGTDIDLKEVKQKNPMENLKILIADDDEISELLISKVIKSFGREILKVTSGDEAVAACRNNSDIDLVLMDIQLPILDGYEATRQIRQFNKDVFIIAQTAYALAGDRENALEAGCNEYITKPINRDELHALIRKFCKGKD